jgi:ABC-type iron transport system FetAB permease component
VSGRTKSHIAIASKFFENVTKFKYLRMICRNKNVIHEEMKSILDLVTACYLLSRIFCLPIWMLFLDVKLGSVALREEHKLSVFENGAEEGI